MGTQTAKNLPKLKIQIHKFKSPKIFLKQLGDYPADTLNETIPAFHNTVKRFEAFELALRRDKIGRAHV